MVSCCLFELQVLKSDVSSTWPQQLWWVPAMLPEAEQSPSIAAWEPESVSCLMQRLTWVIFLEMWSSPLLLEGERKEICWVSTLNTVSDISICDIMLNSNNDPENKNSYPHILLMSKLSHKADNWLSQEHTTKGKLQTQFWDLWVYSFSNELCYFRLL